MTLVEPRTPRRRRQAIGMLSMPLVVAMLLAGCSSAEPEAMSGATPSSSVNASPSATPTPTPTPTRVPASTVVIAEAPLSAEEAIAGATASAQTYLEIRAEIEVLHPADSGGITTVAMEDAAQDVQFLAEEQAASGIVKTGSYTFDVNSPSAGELNGQDGTVVPFGAVSLVGCFDRSAMTATNTDGTPAAVTGNPREAKSMVIIYLAAEEHWIVNKFFEAPADAAPC